MQTLWIDIGNRVAWVALIRDGVVRNEASWDERPSETELMRRLENVLEEGEGVAAPPDRMAAMIGPGGFMGLRTGMTIANALAWVDGIPVGGLMKRDLDIARLQEGESAIWLHSTRRDAVFIAEDRTVEPRLETIDVLCRSIAPGTSYTGDLLPEHEAILGVKRVEPLRAVSEVLPALLENLLYTRPPLLPWYGRGV